MWIILLNQASLSYFYFILYDCLCIQYLKRLHWAASVQVDTISKRLMSSKTNVRLAHTRSLVTTGNLCVMQFSLSTLNFVVFRKYADAAIGRKFLSLFPGLGYAAGYKIIQRIYKWGGFWFPSRCLRLFKISLKIWRTTVRERLPQVSYDYHYIKKIAIKSYLYLQCELQKVFCEYFWRKKWQSHHACFGRQVRLSQSTPNIFDTSISAIGVGEIVLLPLDVLKIKRQCVKFIAHAGKIFHFADIVLLRQN